MFNVGQQVVCVDDKEKGNGEPSGLTRGRVYTVAKFFPVGCKYACGCMKDYDALDVAEAPIIPYPGHEEGYRANRFRPVRPQSIEWAREIARDVKLPVRVAAQ